MKNSKRLFFVAAVSITAQMARADTKSAALVEAPRFVLSNDAKRALGTNTSGGVLISLDFTNAPVADILKMLATEINVNLFLGENVARQVATAKATDKTGEQALALVAKIANLTFRKVDAYTFIVGDNNEETGAKMPSEKIIAPQTEAPRPRVSISRVVKLNIEIRNTTAREALQQIADENDLRLIFLHSPDKMIENLDIVNLSPEAAIDVVAKEAGLNAIPLAFREGAKNISGFLLRDSKKTVSPIPPRRNYNPPYDYNPRYKMMPPYLRSDETPRNSQNLEELDSMVIKPPQDRKFHGLMPQTKNAPAAQSPEATPPK